MILCVLELLLTTFAGGLWKNNLLSLLIVGSVGQTLFLQSLFSPSPINVQILLTNTGSWNGAIQILYLVVLLQKIESFEPTFNP